MRWPDAPFSVPAASNRASGSPAHGFPTSFTGSYDLGSGRVPYQTAAAALVMSSSTWVGRVANEAWLVSSSMVSRAWIRSAIFRWVCGGIIRSWAET